MFKSIIGAVLGGMLLFTATVGCMVLVVPDAEEQDLQYRSLDEMVRVADRIVSGRVVGSTVEYILDSETGDPVEDLVYYELVVTEAFKGSAEVDDTLYVALPLELRLYDRTDGSEVFVEMEGEYLFFLKGRARDRDHPLAYGGTVWTLNGEPSLAVVDGDMGVFLRRDDYPELGTLATVDLENLRPPPPPN